MSIEQAIQKAISVGYQPHSKWRSLQYYEYKILLDPQFFQSLGKAMGWDRKVRIQYDGYFDVDSSQKVAEWQYRMHRFIGHLAEGKTIESFFEALQ